VNVEGVLRKRGLGRVAKALMKRAAPCVGLSEKKTSRFSRLGGLPELPKDVEWPSFEGFPLSFIAQIDLGDVPAGTALPLKGTLSFFYDMRSWGYDPKHRGSAAIVFNPLGPGACESRDIPKGPRSPDFLVIARRALGFRESLSLPSSWSFPEWKDLNEEEMGTYHDLQKEVGGPHRMFGHPHRVQGEMTLQCQLVTHGLNLGGDKGLKDPRVKKLARGAKDWRLLLQIDGEAAGVEFGDAGLIYYWIREADLRAKRFDQAWLILQCY
jgi:uncharacterized protein YwqG